MTKRIRLAFFIAALLLSPMLASASSFVNVTLPESKFYNSTNLLLDFNVNGPITSASYSLNNENNVSMNPVLIFSMENTSTTVTDFSPYANNGQMINNVVYNPNGKYGGALNFDGYNSYISVPHSNSLDVGNAFTISAWIYPTSTFPSRRIIDKAGSYFLELYVPSYPTNNTTYIYFGFYGQNMCPTGNPSKPLDYCLFQIPSVTPISMNQWTHVAGTYDGTTERLFINGVEDNRQEWTSMTVNNITSPITINKTTSPLLIGSDATAAYTFGGMIDEVRVYNSSLALRPWVSVLNPNFEEPTASDLDPLRTSEYYTNYWRYEPCDEVPANVVCTPKLYWDTSVYRSANHSMKIVNTNPDDLAWLAQNPNRFKSDVIGGRSYTEEVWIKSANMSNVSDDGFRLLHLWWNSAWQNFDAYYCNYTTQNYNSWTKITCTATAPIGAVKGDFVIELNGPGTVWVDDANFTSDQPMPHWITNGLNNVTVFVTASGVVSSDTKIFTVNQAPTYVNLSVNLLLNGAENNTTLAYPQNLTAVFSTNVLTATMYRNGMNVSSENGASIKLGVGYYNYTVVNPGNQNYTGSSKTLFANITQATSNCFLVFNPISYLVSLNASCVCTNPEAPAVLWRNETDVTTENNQIVNLSTGSYNYVCNVSQTQNYTSASNSSYYIINVNQNSTLADGSSCTASNQCSGGYCLHGICRNSSTYCGDETCDAGENCSSCSIDCGNCSNGGGGEGGGIICGDGVCDSGENCSSCSIDCGNCSGGGCGGGGFYKPPIRTCREDWTCTDWTLCTEGIKTRACTDQNKCGTTKTKPIESKSCDETTPLCTENWTCTDWSTCYEGTQARVCTDTNSCGTTSNKPSESQNCIIDQNSTNPVRLTINNGTLYTDQNVSIENGTSVTVNCYNVYSNSGSCNLYRDDNLTANNTNETVTLDVGTYAYKVNTTGNADYSENSTGETFYLTVALADSYCGDEVCDAGESCSSCPADCGACQTTQQSSGGGGFLGGGILTCTENWNCTDWSSCSGEIQIRSCTDKNKCNTIKNKPAESRTCKMSISLATPDTPITPDGTSKNKTVTAANQPPNNELPADPTGLFIGLSMNELIFAVIAGAAISSIIIFISMRREKEKTYKS